MQELFKQTLPELPLVQSLVIQQFPITQEGPQRIDPGAHPLELDDELELEDELEVPEPPLLDDDEVHKLLEHNFPEVH